MKINSNEVKFYLDDLESKINDSLHDNDAKQYFRLYENLDNEQLKKIFSYFHSKLNTLFDFMNSKSKTNNHYNAGNSRDLLSVIEDLESFLQKTNKMQFEVTLDTNYQNKIQQSKVFLRTSGGSPIPDDFQAIEIVKYKPIFQLKNVNLPTKAHNVVNQYEHLPDFIKEAQEDLLNERYWDVITKARTILEITFKEICKRHSLTFDDKNVNTTFMNIRKHFGMVAKESKYPDYIKGLITNTASLVNNIAEARNKNSSSHAPEYKPKKHHAQFCLEQSISLMNFIISIDESKK